MLIIDEAHYLRNEETATHKLAQLLRPVVQSMVMLSATPIQLRSRDLFNLLHLLDADSFPYESSFDFALRANAPILALRDSVLAGVRHAGRICGEPCDWRCAIASSMTTPRSNT
jgi:hypothetical protein